MLQHSQQSFPGGCHQEIYIQGNFSQYNPPTKHNKVGRGRRGARLEEHRDPPCSIQECNAGLESD